MGIIDFFFKQAGLDKLGNTRAYDEEFSTEMYDKTFNTSTMPPYNPYSTNGIHIDKSTDHIRLLYNGILAKNGARDVYAVIGYGDNNKWEGVKQYPMHSAGYQTFELLVPVNSDKSMNIAFKDAADNWDNNSGMNYTFNKSFYGGSH